jgi:di/tripeptidase
MVYCNQWLIDCHSNGFGCHQAYDDTANEAGASGLSFSTETVGDRPAGSIPRDHELVLGALAALACVGIKGALEAGSTDANVPLAQGCPAVTIGITRGGNAHRLDEFIETKPVKRGLQQLITLALAAAEHYAAAS